MSHEPEMSYERSETSHMEIIAEVDVFNRVVQVRKTGNCYDVGYLDGDTFDIRHPNCGPDGAIRALSHYLNSVNYKLQKVLNAST